jgi:hypothetical protein
MVPRPTGPMMFNWHDFGLAFIVSFIVMTTIEQDLKIRLLQNTVSKVEQCIRNSDIKLRTLYIEVYGKAPEEDG